MRVELTLSAFEMHNAPGEPIWFSVKWKRIANANNGETALSFKWVRDELTFSVSCNDETPKSPMSLLFEYNLNGKQSKNK